jgi:hypothetical protein
MRGVYENPAGSGIWWIHYYAVGNGTAKKSDANPTQFNRAKRMP